MFRFTVSYVLLFLFCFTIGYGFAAQQTKHVNVTAFIRVKNEIPTLKACLNSIDGIFDKIVMIYSEEPDDGSIEVMTSWCNQRKNCSVYAYPYAVIPSHDKRYSTNYSHKNSLAAYTQFGWDKIDDNDFVVKIDADQVYIKNHLENLINKVRAQAVENDKIRWGFKGYNTFVLHDRLVKYRPVPLNGGYDSHIIKKRYLKNFYQKGPFELMKCQNGLDLKIVDGIYWFHFMDTLKQNGSVRSANEATPNEIEPLTIQEKQLFETHIRPLFTDESPYKDIKL